MLSIRDLLTELLFPLRGSSTLLGAALFMILLTLVSIAAYIAPVLGVAASLTLGIAALPGFLRFLVLYLEARAHDRAPAPLDAEHFSWMTDRWGMFPVVLFAASGWLLYTAKQSESVWLPIATAAAILLVLPASLTVLAMTHSPLQALHPGALLRFVVRLRTTYWVAPLAAAISVAIFRASLGLPPVILGGLALYLMLVCCGVFGAVPRHAKLADDVDLPEMTVDAGIPAFRLKRREDALNLAYSFMSRDGVENGIKHIESAIAEESDDLSAWRWYFEQMLGWENPYFACRFGQRYIKALLGDDDVVGVAKIIMRCRLIDERFKPASDDIPAARSALERAGNLELANSLTR